jgi:hypothetical protein
MYSEPLYIEVVHSCTHMTYVQCLADMYQYGKKLLRRALMYVYANKRQT